MTMEHIVQFGINLDDASIAEAVKRDAYKEVIKQLTDEARKALPRKYEYGSRGNYEVDWRGIIDKEVEKRVSAIISDKSDKIVEMAVKRVYDSIIRRKPFREACKKMDIIFDGIGGDSDD
jgi:hypothetical protein